MGEGVYRKALVVIVREREVDNTTSFSTNAAARHARPLQQLTT